MSNGEFSVYQFFLNDTREDVLRFVDPETAVKCAKGLCESVGGQIGSTRRVIVTDGGDCICFEWIFGQGVVFPSLDQLKENQKRN